VKTALFDGDPRYFRVFTNVRRIRINNAGVVCLESFSAGVRDFYLSPVKVDLEYFTRPATEMPNEAFGSEDRKVLVSLLKSVEDLAFKVFSNADRAKLNALSAPGFTPQDKQYALGETVSVGARLSAWSVKYYYSNFRVTKTLHFRRGHVDPSGKFVESPDASSGPLYIDINMSQTENYSGYILNDVIYTDALWKVVRFGSTLLAK